MAFESSGDIAGNVLHKSYLFFYHGCSEFAIVHPFFKQVPLKSLHVEVQRYISTRIKSSSRSRLSSSGMKLCLEQPRQRHRTLCCDRG